MDYFQKTVLFASIVIFIITLLVITFLIYRTKKTVIYPPVVADCPDYWIEQAEGDSSSCINTKNLGKSSCNTKMNFKTSQWIGKQGLCNKSKWAKTCDLTWDGVTNNLNACLINPSK
jgi:hypothetical protein